MSWGGSQQSMDVVFCPFFLARILDPQVSNLCLSSLMGWSEVLLGFYLLARPSAWPFSWTPSLLLHAQNWQMHQGNKTEQNRTEHCNISTCLWSYFPPLSTLYFHPLVARLILLFSFSVCLWQRSYLFQDAPLCPIMNLHILGKTTSKPQTTIQHFQEAIYGNKNSRRFITHFTWEAKWKK